MFIGDVFRGNPSFEFGRKTVGNLPYIVGTDPVQVSDDYKETYLITYIDGYDPVTGVGNKVTGPRDALDDATRVGAEYVVESVRNAGGDEREMIRDEPHVVARRLNDDGSYNPTGELIKFVYKAPGARSFFNTAATVKVTRTMKRVVNFI